MKAVIVYLVRQTDNAVKLQAAAQSILPHVSHTDILLGSIDPNATDPDRVVDRSFFLRDEPATRIQVLVAIQPGVRDQLRGLVASFHNFDEVDQRVLDWCYVSYGANHAGKTEEQIRALAETYARANLAADKVWSINQDTVFPQSIVGEFA